MNEHTNTTNPAPDHTALLRQALTEMENANAVTLKACGMGVVDIKLIQAIKESLK